MSCVTILFLNLQITGSDIRPHIKWAVILVIAYDHFNLPIIGGLCGYVGVNILTLSPLRGLKDGDKMGVEEGRNRHWQRERERDRERKRECVCIILLS